MLDTIKSWWTSVKDWFKNSETILIARIETLTGFIVVAIGAMDWSPLFSAFGTGTAFNKAELYAIGGVTLVKGIFTEWARRLGTIEVNSKLIPTEIVKSVTTEITPNLPTAVTTETTTQTVAS